MQPKKLEIILTKIVVAIVLYLLKILKLPIKILEKLLKICIAKI